MKIVSIFIIVIIVLVAGFVVFQSTNISNYSNNSPDCSEISYSDSDNDGKLDISNVYELQCIELDENYELVKNIDASDTECWNNGKGFDPIGSIQFPEENSSRFNGILMGQGYKVDNLYVDRPSDISVGLFGGVGRDGKIDRIGMTNVNINGSHNNTSYTGGLVGRNSGDISDSYTSGKVEGGKSVGVLIGENNGTVTDSNSTGSVSGTTHVGGLVGFNTYGSVSGSYSTGSVNGSNRVGGLVGTNGFNDRLGGSVSGSYWDTESSGQSTSAGSATGLTTSEMQGSSASSNMGGLDFSETWSTVSGEYPVLDSFDESEQINNR